MFVNKKFLVILCAVLAIKTAESIRVARSPDNTMEVVVPDSPADYNSDYDKQRVDEEEYWQGEGTDAGQRQQDNLEDMSQSNNGQDAYESEREHQENQGDRYMQEGNDTYNTNRENADSHQTSNEEHYVYNGDDDMGTMGQEANDELDNQSSDKYNRYQEKLGNEMNNRQQGVSSYDPKAPSVNYNLQ